MFGFIDKRDIFTMPNTRIVEEGGRGRKRAEEVQIKY